MAAELSKDGKRLTVPAGAARMMGWNRTTPVRIEKVRIGGVLLADAKEPENKLIIIDVRG